MIELYKNMTHTTIMEESNIITTTLINTDNNVELAITKYDCHYMGRRNFITISINTNDSDSRKFVINNTDEAYFDLFTRLLFKLGKSSTIVINTNKDIAKKYGENSIIMIKKDDKIEFTNDFFKNSKLNFTYLYDNKSERQTYEAFESLIEQLYNQDELLPQKVNKKVYKNSK